MSEAADATIAAHHAPTGFWRKYIFSTDHKTIGKQFMLTTLFMLMLGGFFAVVFRWQLAWPGSKLPLGDYLPESVATGGVLNPDFYLVLVTMHATVMIFFVLIPMLMGAFANFVLPLQIGARDMAFPTLNMLSYWMMWPAIALMTASMLVEGGGAATGWTAYPPLSSIASPGQTLWLLSLGFVGTSSLMGAINYVTTTIRLRAPGMAMWRLPLTTWAIFVTATIILFSTPVLAGSQFMLLSDRMFGTSFFAPADGGQPLLYQHIFWFYSHPAVYIMVLPAMGIVSDLLSNFARKPIFGYRAMVFSLAAIGIIGFIVWGHHMFASGMNPLLGVTFTISTLIIAVPSAIKTFNWLGTLWGGELHFRLPMVYALGFVAMFVIGGLSGIFMAATPVDIYIHDTYIIVAHFHYIFFGASVLGIFAGIAYWFPKMFGRLMNERLGKVHFWGTFLTLNGVFFPMHILGIGGMIRRTYDPTFYDFMKPLQPLNVFMTISAILLGLFQLLFLVNVFWSMRRGEKAGPNPWNANTLEWTIPSPAPPHNYDRIPVVHHGPHEYNIPGIGKDHVMQTDDLEIPAETVEKVLK